MRRRYGYAALRVMRKALRAAWADHKRREVGADPYDGEKEREAILRQWFAARRRLASRWPTLSWSDERAQP